MSNAKPLTTHMPIKFWYDPVKDEHRIEIVVPYDYLFHCQPAKNNLSHLIDMPQFFGMLEDAVCMKLGLEPPRTNKDGHNVAA